MVAGRLDFRHTVRQPSRRWSTNTCEEETILTAQRSLVQRVSFEPNPALVEHARKRAESVQNRIADRITAFAGSMAFVYLHIVWFGSWIAFGVEGTPTAC